MALKKTFNETEDLHSDETPLRVDTNENSDEVLLSDEILTNKSINTNQNDNTTSTEDSSVTYTDDVLEHYHWIKNWLIDVFGIQIIMHAKKITGYQKPYHDQEEDIGEWLLNVLKTLLLYNEKENDVSILYFNINEYLDKYINEINLLSQKNTQIIKRLELELEVQSKIKQENENYKNKCDDLEDMCDSRIPIDIFIYQTLGKDELAQRFMNIWDDAIKYPSKNLTSFAVSFVEAWYKFVDKLNKIINHNEDEDTFINAIHHIIIEFLFDIKGKYIVQRRLILSSIAKICSEKLKNHYFFSPEDSTQIDIAFHNIKENKGGNFIYEAISFGVIKKDGLQVIKHADIISK